MSRLNKRVERLEGGRTEGVIVWGHAPDNWPEARQTAAVVEAAREYGVDRPEHVTVFPRPASECEGVRLIFVGTGDELTALIHRMWDLNSKAR